MFSYKTVTYNRRNGTTVTLDTYSGAPLIYVRFDPHDPHFIPIVD